MVKQKKDYVAEDIKVLKGLEPVRKRAGMYIGNTGRQGLNHLVQELIDNAVDEHLAGACDEIYVSINKDGSATVVDNGRGVPVDMHEEGMPAERVIFTTLHAGGKFNDSAYKISGGLHGVGSSVVNALSNKLIVDVYRDGFVHHDTYERGEPTTKLVGGYLPKEKLKEKRTGTSVTLYPDDTIFETVKFKTSAIRQRLKETAYLNPNLTIIYENNRDDREREVFHYEDGLGAFVEEISAEYERISPIISVSGEKDGVMADIVFVMTEDANENIFGFTNNISNVDGGTHIIGFESGFANLINKYAKNELGLLKENEKNLRGADIRNGMLGVISVRIPEPEFEGQTKTRLGGGSEVVKTIESIVMEQLTLYFDRNYEVLKNIVDRAISITKKRNNEKNKVNVGKFSFEGNGKLAKQESNKPEECEIFIVEGNSAGGTAKTARNRRTQAVLPLRGKILNVEKAPTSKILDNAEIKAMINAFGCGFMTGCGKDFDISKLNYHKIIIMTDADVDGSHIATLLLTLFYRCFPQLIKEGYVYVATPPLYKVKSDKEAKYLYTDAELNECRKKQKKSFKLQRYKGLGEMDADQLWETTMNPENRILKRVSIDSIIEANLITQTLMGAEVGPRRTYIEEHGQEAIVDV